MNKGRAIVANKSVFKSAPKGKAPPVANTVNRAGGKAYALGEKAALAQYASTGTFNDTFYSKAEDQISEVLALLPKVDVEFIGKTAIYAHEQGRMKDMPALLVAHLATRGDEGLAVLKRVFPVVISNGKMLRNFAQIIRSGQVGRKSFGTALKKLIHSWFLSKAPEDIFKMSVGNDPSFGDILQMVHLAHNEGPGRTASPERNALFKYLKGVDHDADSLPPLMKDYLKFKSDPHAWDGALPKVPFEMLMGLPLSEQQWSALAQQCSWNQLRMNLNTFSRHGVFKDDGISRTLAAKLSDAALIEKARPFPYQIFTAYIHTSTTGEEAVPQVIRTAMHAALEIATKHVITYDGQAHVAVDTSGSMYSNPVTGARQGATTKMNCIDVAALIACTFLRKNPETKLWPFDTRLHATHDLEPMDSIMTNANKLRRFGGGGTDCGLVLAHLNKIKAKGDLVVYASDNESWFDNNRNYGLYGNRTSMANEWAAYKARNPKAKLVCIDLAVGATTQVASDTSVLNIGGFSDSVWEVIKSFVEGMPSADHWVSVINSVQLPAQA